MVHNKEKGAARWTFDFFKEVAAIVEGDAQFMEMALSCGASRSPGHSPPPLLQSTGQPGTDDLSSYSFGGASRPPHHTAGAGPPPPPPLGHHRMSEPNLAPHLYSGGYNASHGLRAQPSFRAAQQQQQQHPHHHPQQSHHHHHHYRHFPHGQKMSPIELCSAATAAPGPLSAFEGRQNGRYSPSRRTSYPQMQAHMIGSAALGQPLPPPPQQQQQMLAATPVPASAGAVDGKFPSHQRHSIQVLSPPFHQGRGSVVSLPAHPGSGGRDTPVGRLSPGDNLAEPERACRYVLDMLETQVRRIDAQHEALGQLRASTQDAIARVEQVLQRYTHPQS
ncbi:hypothetical protein H4R19_002263 [Coemansia spiralis]|nr:hypothetical protein H4R19_002263 [Coemansia spiralis]